jgi:hypothetical protein
VSYDKFIWLYVWIPVLELYSEQPRKLSSNHEAILNQVLAIMRMMLGGSSEEEEASREVLVKIITDWSVKSVNFELD